MFKRTHELPQIQLTDPIWTVEHISAALRIGERAVRDVIKRPGFPAPSRLGAGPPQEWPPARWWHYGTAAHPPTTSDRHQRDDM